MTSLELKQEPIAVNVNIDEAKQRFEVELADGRSITVPFEWYPRLAHGTPTERLHWQLLGDGAAIEWIDLDEHIGVDGLLAGCQSGESRASLEKWLLLRKGDIG